MRSPSSRWPTKAAIMSSQCARRPPTPENSPTRAPPPAPDAASASIATSSPNRPIRRRNRLLRDRAGSSRIGAIVVHAYPPRGSVIAARSPA